MSATAPLDTLVIPTPCVQILKGRMFAAAYVALKETVETAQVNSISVIKFATLEARGNWSQNVFRNWFWIVTGDAPVSYCFLFNIEPFTLWNCSIHPQTLMNVPAPSQTNATLTPCVQTPKDPIYVAVWKDLVAMEQSAKVTNSCQSLVVFNKTAV